MVAKKAAEKAVVPVAEKAAKVAKVAKVEKVEKVAKVVAPAKQISLADCQKQNQAIQRRIAKENAKKK